MPSGRVPLCNERRHRLEFSAQDTVCSSARLPNCTFTKTMQVLPLLEYGQLVFGHATATNDPILQQSNEQCDQTSSSVQNMFHTVKKVCASPWHDSDKSQALCGSRVSSRCTMDRLNRAPSAAPCSLAA